MLAGGFGLGLGFAGFIFVICYSAYAFYDEFKKPINEQERKERLAYLEAKQKRWESYFKER